eukprot:2942882-Amphidinium_carterae.1
MNKNKNNKTIKNAMFSTKVATIINPGLSMQLIRFFTSVPVDFRHEKHTLSIGQVMVLNACALGVAL